ncbi:MAG: pilus assembly protein TadG-related protein [Acidobacteriota bacterium]|nr:pilus assembly protein TadG-related protein [Acidobacteriota bacterium]
MKRIFMKHGEKSGTVRLEPVAGDARKRRQHGVVMMLTALMITVMIGFLSLSIDLGFAFSSRNQFQNGIDAAALAAAAAMRLTIESTEAGAQQLSVAQQQAIDYAKLNQVRRYADPGKDDNSPNANDIVIGNGNVAVTAKNQSNFDFPQVKVDSSIPVPTLFAGMFGLNGFTVSAASTASVVPVDGGTGTPGAGKPGGGGCWSPIMIPDTFFDSSDNVHWVGDPNRGSDELPSMFGDYYRSRFAAGARNVPPYVDAANGGVGNYVTGLRDTAILDDINLNKTVMGRYIEIKPAHYRIAKLSNLPLLSAFGLSVSGYSVGDFARNGYCGQIRVGLEVEVYDRNDLTVYDQAKLGLQALKSNTLDNDFLDLQLLNNYRYIKTSSYPGPNTHAMVVPVMMFSPVELVRNQDAASFRVTNIGLIFLQEVRDDGTLYGFFVREIIAGGTPIEPGNLQTDNAPTFKRSWLPMSVQLLK